MISILREGFYQVGGMRRWVHDLSDQKSNKRVFVREASGLIKEISTTKGTFFNLANTIGGGATLVTAYVVLYPFVLWASLPVYSWVILLSLPFDAAYVLCLAVLCQMMPRTGGDYVFTSRITSPLAGFIESWMLLWGTASITGFNAWLAIYSIGNITTAGVVFGQSFVSLGSILTNNTSLLIMGMIEFGIAAFVYIRPPRTVYRTLTVLGIASIVAVVLLLIPLMGVSPTGFDINFSHYTGTSAAQVIQIATQHGYDPSATYSSSTFLSLLAFALYIPFGFTSTVYLAGEVKGNVSKNIFTSAMCTALFNGIMVGLYFSPFFRTAGSDLVNAWAYLYFNAGSLSPLMTAPTTIVLAALANPNLGAFTLILGIPVEVFFNFVVLLASIGLATRILFAQSMDRTLPKRFAEVSEKTNQPNFSILVWVIVCFIFFLITVYGASPVNTLYYTLFVGFPSFLFPAVNVIVLKWKKPELFQLAPAWARRSILGVPVIAWVGIAWLVFLLPAFGAVDFWGLVSTLVVTPGGSLLNFTFSSGLLLTLVSLFSGIAWYYGVRAYHKRRGFDLDLVFKQIPPE